MTSTTKRPMQLTPEEQAILDGSQGEIMAKIMKTVVMYGETFGAERLVETTGPSHLVTSFGISVMTALFDVMDELIAAGLKAKEPFTVDPRPLDHENVPCNLLQKIVFGVMYGTQDRYEEQLKKLGLKGESAFSCTCYMDEVGNVPKKGDILSWAESSAVVYANSVIGARCNRNSAYLDLFGAILGKTPYFDLLTDEGRRAKWLIEVRTSKTPEAQILGSAIGLKVMEDVPYIRGLDKFLGHELDADVKAYLKDMGAASASNGAVGLYHVEGLTPEAVEQGDALLLPDYKVYVIDDAELKRVKDSYPLMWKSPDTKPKLAFIGCPHLSIGQLKSWTDRLEKGLKASGRKSLRYKTVLTAAPGVLEAFRATPDYERLRATGAHVSYICPLMYMNNPLCKNMPVLTNSNKLRTYTTARYMTDDEITAALTGKETGR